MAASPRFTEGQTLAILERAEDAAQRAFDGASPTPMVIGTPKNLMASLTGGDDGGFDPSQPTYYVNDGVCGFAWVNVRPANGSFARRVKAATKERNPYYASKGYYGGLEIRPDAGRMSQSYERKLAACRAYAAVLQEYGITAYADGRLD
jgi:hypothetical protein